MEHAPHAGCERFQLTDGFFETIALMNDTVEAQLGSDFKMLLEQVRLFLFVTRVFFKASAFLAGQVMVVETGFAERDNFRTFCELPQSGTQVVRGVERLARMPANYGIHRLESRRQINGAAAGF